MESQHEPTYACSCNPILQSCSMCGLTKRQVERWDRGKSFDTLYKERWVINKNQNHSYVSKLRGVK